MEIPISASGSDARRLTTGSDYREASEQDVDAEKTGTKAPLSTRANSKPAHENSLALSRSGLAAWTILVLYLALVLPLFLRMPLCCDVDLHNVMARFLVRGELPYKEVVFPSFAGMPLIYASAQVILGWSYEALRWVDLLFVIGATWLLAGKLPSALSRAGRVWLAFTLLLFYVGTSEWCHCQPDTWMLLPAAGALYFRCRQVLGVASQEALASLGRQAVLEGICWGLAFIIKPFVALAALACIGVTVVVAFRVGRAALKRLAVDLGGVLLGGLLVGAASVAWLYLSGNWPYFLENLRQGPGFEEYYALSAGWSIRFKIALVRLWPWSLVHLAALPLALLALARVAIFRPATALGKEPILLGRAMLAACYLAWFAQANYIQRQFDYHLASPLLLALVLVASHDYLFRPRVVRWVALPVLLFIALQFHPLLQPTRLSAWTRCWQGGSPELREQLGSLDKNLGVFMPTWPELAAVEQFLKEQGARDKDVTCWCNSSLALYSDLGIQPSSRYVQLASWLGYAPQRTPAIVAEIIAGPQRFIVTDLHESLGVHLTMVPQVRRLSPKLVAHYPWNQPVVFRAGRYLVHRVDRTPSAP